MKGIGSYLVCRNNGRVSQSIKSISAAIVLSVLLLSPTAYADTYDARISELQRQNASSRAAQGVLADQEAGLDAQVAGLRAEIAAVQNQINASEAKRAELIQNIAAAEAETVKQKAILKANVRQMYLDDTMSTLEKLATSKSFSHYVDREQYQTAVQNKINTAIQRIKELKEQMDRQKADVENLLADQQAMNARLQSDKAEIDRLLSFNLEQQQAYSADIAANNSQITELRRQQAIENARHFKAGYQTGGNGGYPWANAPFPNSIVDPWGMYQRQCVSYTAWKVDASGRYMPYWGGRGNAKQWDDNARAAGIPVDTNPQVGDVAVSNAGVYGHVMYVEAVHDDDTITISQYNAGWDGRYSTGRRTTAGLVFIHFPFR